MTDEVMVYDSQGRLIPLNRKISQPTEITTTATIQTVQPEPQLNAKGPSVIERVASFMMPKKKSPEETPGTLASMQQQGRILRETKRNVRYQDIKRIQEGAKKYTSQVSKYLGGETKTVYVTDKKTGKLVSKQIRTKGLQQRLSPSRLASGVRGAKRVEKGLSQYRAAATGVAGMLFPMSGASQQLRTKGMSRGKAGRPQGVYKHVIPGVGPVHVYTYRKWLRAQRQKATQAAAMREQAYVQKMMQRGLPPQMAYEQAQMLQQAREAQAYQEVQEAQGMPQQQVPQQYQQYPQQMQPQPSMQAYRASVPQARAPLGAPSRSPINPLGPDRQQQFQQPGMKREISFFNSNVQRMVPVNERKERWVAESSGQRLGQLGLRKQPQGGYY